MNSDYIQHYEAKTEYYYRHASVIKVDTYYLEINGKKEPRPTVKLINRDKTQIVGRKVIGYTLNTGVDVANHLGMGFFGLLLEPKDPSSKREWMVVTIGTSASYHCLLDSRWIEAMHTEENAGSSVYRPGKDAWVVYGRGSNIIKDDFSNFIKSCIITDIDLQPSSCKITLEKDGRTHLLEILNGDSRLCPLPLPGYEYKIGKEARYGFPKAFQEGTDHIGNYIIFMEENGQIYV